MNLHYTGMMNLVNAVKPDFLPAIQKVSMGKVERSTVIHSYADIIAPGYIKRIVGSHFFRKIRRSFQTTGLLSGRVFICVAH